MKVELPDELDPSNVISIEVLRANAHLRAMRGQCTHIHVYVDPTLAELSCRDCEAKLSPTAWIADMAEWWYRVQGIFKRYQEARELLEKRRRTTCQHCGRVTGITRDTKFEVSRAAPSGTEKPR